MGRAAAGKAEPGTGALIHSALQPPGFIREEKVPVKYPGGQAVRLRPLLLAATHFALQVCSGHQSKGVPTAEGRRKCPREYGRNGLRKRRLIETGLNRRRFDSCAAHHFMRKGGLPVKFARTCAGLGAVCSVGIALALLCDHLAALLDAALAIC